MYHNEAQNAAYAQLNAVRENYVPPAPQPTDMETHIQRVASAGKRLHLIRENLEGLISRLYGEGQTAAEKQPAAIASGMSGIMGDALTNVDEVTARIEYLVSRLAQFA